MSGLGLALVVPSAVRAGASPSLLEVLRVVLPRRPRRLGVVAAVVGGAESCAFVFKRVH